MATNDRKILDVEIPLRQIRQLAYALQAVALCQLDGDRLLESTDLLAELIEERVEEVQEALGVGPPKPGEGKRLNGEGTVNSCDAR
ncbi:MAG: hypothetical protein ACFCUR_20915 [Rhodomicrobiaceae bacterium]